MLARRAADVRTRALGQERRNVEQLESDPTPAAAGASSLIWPPPADELDAVEVVPLAPSSQEPFVPPPLMARSRAHVSLAKSVPPLTDGSAAVQHPSVPAQATPGQTLATPGQTLASPPSATAPTASPPVLPRERIQMVPPPDDPDVFRRGDGVRDLRLAFDAGERPRRLPRRLAVAAAFVLAAVAGITMAGLPVAAIWQEWPLRLGTGASSAVASIVSLAGPGDDLPDPPPVRSAATPALTPPAPAAAAGPAVVDRAAPARGRSGLSDAPPRGAPAAVAATAPTATPTDEAHVRTAIERYAATYRAGDEDTGSAVGTPVDARAVSRTLAGLDAQSLELGRCHLDVRASAARAECPGWATSVPSVGGSTPQPVAGMWSFQLRKVEGAWQIVDVTR